MFGVHGGGSGMIRGCGKNVRGMNRSWWRRWEVDEVSKPSFEQFYNFESLRSSGRSSSMKLWGKEARAWKRVWPEPPVIWWSVVVVRDDFRFWGLKIMLLPGLYLEGGTRFRFRRGGEFVMIVLGSRDGC